PPPAIYTLSLHDALPISPRSSVIASYLVIPGDLRLALGSPPSRCSMTSVVRLSALTREIPATCLPFHFTRNLKFLEGSYRCLLTVNFALCASSVFDIFKQISLFPC